MSKEILLIKLTGSDKPGLTAAIGEIMAKYQVNILDMGQSVIHDQLNLGLLIEIPAAQNSASVVKDLLFGSHEMGLTAQFEPVDEIDYEGWVSSQGKPRHILTILARQITAEHVAEVGKVVAAQGLNIDNISRLSGRISLTTPAMQGQACVELSVRGQAKDPSMLKAEFLDIAQRYAMDIGFQADDVFRRNRRLVVFDMDSTLIKTEVIDELAVRAGVGEQVAEITERAMQGELDFSASFRERLALLKGLDESVLADIAANLPLTEGAQRLISTLKRLGYKTAILSGGFNYFGKHLQQMLGIDYVYANELEIENGKVTGRVKGEIVDGLRKKQLLEEIAQKENIALEQVIAVGDGANDLPMLSVAGLGIAFRAKPLVRQNAEHAISTLGLDSILYLIGVRDREALNS